MPGFFYFHGSLVAVFYGDSKCEFSITFGFTKIIMLNALRLLGNVRVRKAVLFRKAPLDPQHTQ